MKPLEAILGLDTGPLDRGVQVAGRLAGGLADSMARASDKVRQAVGGQARSFEELRASVDPAYAAQQRYAQIQRDVAAMVASGEASQRSANIVLQQAAVRYMGVETAAQVAARAQREHAQTVEAATRSYAALRSAVDPIYAASKRYEAAQEQLNAAVRAGVITQSEMNRVLALTANQHLGLATAQGRVAGSSNRLTSAVTNASFQVQDFAVQVASGQSATTALAQQLPQLLGAFGFTGRIALWGSLLGTVVAVGAAVAPMLLNMGAKAKTAQESIDDLSAAVARYREYSELSQASSADLAQRFGDLGGRASKLAEFMSEIAQIKALREADSAMAKIAETFGGFSKKVEDMRMRGGANALSIMLGGMDANFLTQFQASTAKLRAELKLTESQAVLVANALAAATDAKGTEEQLAAAAGLRDAFEQAFGSLLKVPAQLQEIAIQTGMVALSASEITDKADAAVLRGNAILENRIGIWGRAIAAAEAQQAAVNGQLDAQREQIVLLNAIAAYGADSAQVEAIKRNAALATADAYIEQHNLTGRMATEARNVALGLFDAQVNAANAANALRDAEAAAKGLAAAIAAAAGFSANLDNGVVVLQAKIDALRSGANAANAATVAGMRLEAQAMRDRAVAAGEDALVANSRLAIDMAQITTQERLLGQIEAQTEANRSATSASKAAGAASAKTAKDLASEAERWRDLIDPMAKYRREHAELEVLLKAGKLTKGEVAKALQHINAELANANPLFGQVGDAIGNFVASGLKGFGDLLDSFKTMVKEMIATAIANPIKLGLSAAFGGGGIAGTAAAAVPGGAPGAGGAVGLLGQIGGIGASFFSGASGLVTSLFGAGGGFGAASTYLASVVGTATSSLGAFAAAAGALAGPLLAVVGVFSFFRSKTKLLDAGMRLTVEGVNTLVETFRKVEKSRFWGLSKSTRVTYDGAPDAVANPIQRAVRDMQGNIEDMAGVLGIGSDAFADFVHQITFSTQGMTDDQVAAELQRQMTSLGDAYAGVAFRMVGTNDALIASLRERIAAMDGMAGGFGIFGTAGLQRELEAAIAGNTLQAADAATAALMRDGEGAMAMLERLASSLTAVNLVGDTLGHTFRAVGIAGAAVASDLADAFGGLEAMSSATGRYYAFFYSDAERQATLLRQTSAALARMNILMPQTRDQYRALIESLDVTTESGRTAYATLIGLAETFDQLLPAVGNLSAALMGMVGGVTTEVDAMIATTTEAQRNNAQASANWYRASRSLRDVVDRMRGTTSALTSASQAMAFNEAQYQATLAAALAGDMTAATNVAGASDRLLASARETARTAQDLARVEARILSDLGLLAGVGDIEGARHDVIAGLLTSQVDLLGQVRSVLAAGGALDAAQLAALNAQLGSLEGAIAAAEDISYARLRERIEVSVDLLATADIPADLRALLADETRELTRTVEFIARSGLTPPEMWLALNSASEHVRTVDFIAGSMQWPAEVQALALTAGGTYQRVVQFLARNMMPATLSELALSDASELLRSIRFTAGALPAQIRDLVLTETASLQRTVDILMGDTIPDDQQRLALDKATAFKRVIDTVAGRVLPADLQRLALADPAGFARSIGFLAGRQLPADLQRLALDQATTFQRVVDLRAGATLDVATARIALATSSDLRRVVHLVAGSALPPDVRMIALAGNSELSRTVNAILSSGIPADARRLALGNVGAYAVAIEAALSPRIPDDVRRIVLSQAGTYTASIGAAISASMPEAARRILLAQQGQFTTNITGILVQDMPGATRALLVNANTEGLRAITLAAAFAQTLTPEQRAALQASGTTVLRTIMAAVNPAGLSAEGLLFLRQMSDGVATTVGRTIDGRVTLARLTAQDQRLLMLDAGTVQRAVAGSVRLGPMTPEERRILWASPGTVTRVIAGSVTLRDSPYADHQRVLRAESGVVQRVIAGSVTLRNSPYWDHTLVLRAESGTIARVIAGQVTLAGGPGADQLRILRAEAGAIDRIIRGQIQLGALTPQQQALLAAIGGASDGRILLGGSFAFDPSAGFRSWFEGSTRVTMTAPLTEVRIALNTLIGVLRADILARREAVAREQAIASAQASLQAAATARASSLTGLNNVVAQVEALERSTGGQLRLGQGDAQLGVVGDRLAYRADGLTGPAAAQAKFRSHFWNDGGLEDQLYAQDRAVAAASARLAAARAAVAALGAVPAFAAGGLHAGGLRLVGEDGPELEATGPARIYSAPQTRALLADRGGEAGDSALAAAMREMARELAALRAENRALLMRLAKDQRDQARIARDWDQNGLPQERTA